MNFKIKRFRRRLVNYILVIGLIASSVVIYNYHFKADSALEFNDNKENNNIIDKENKDKNKIYNSEYFNNNVRDKYYDKVTLKSTIDGDTAKFDVNGKEEKIRFLAIDTPETVKNNTPVEAYGLDASKYTKEKLNNAREIILEYEKANDYDKYNRLLAWVFIDGQLLQELLVKEGLAEVKYVYGDYKYTDKLYDAQKYAKDNKLGIWSK